jgi:hypothetical protein
VQSASSDGLRGTADRNRRPALQVRFERVAPRWWLEAIAPRLAATVGSRMVVRAVHSRLFDHCVDGLLLLTGEEVRSSPRSIASAASALWHAVKMCV